MSYQAEYIWIDGTEPTPLLRSKTRIVEDGKDPGIWGFDGSSTNQAEGNDSDCVLQPVFICPDPLRAEGDKLVMCEVLHPDMTPHSTNTRRKCGRNGGEVRRPGALVRHRAGIHLLPVRAPPGLARSRVPGAPGPLLLRCRGRQDARPGDRRAPHRSLHEGRPRNRRHQRRGHDGPVGVPDRRAPAAAHRRPVLDGALAALPYRRGLRRLRHPRAQARARGLEWCRCPHELLHEGHA